MAELVSRSGRRIKGSSGRRCVTPARDGSVNDSDSACPMNPALLALVDLAALWGRHMK